MTISSLFGRTTESSGLSGQSSISDLHHYQQFPAGFVERGDDEGWSKSKSDAKGKASLSALTLLAFLYFLHMLLGCLKDTIDSNQPDIVVMQQMRETGDRRVVRSLAESVAPRFKGDVGQFPDSNDVTHQEHPHGDVRWSDNVDDDEEMSVETVDGEDGGWMAKVDYSRLQSIRKADDVTTVSDGDVIRNEFKISNMNKGNIDELPWDNIWKSEMKKRDTLAEKKDEKDLFETSLEAPFVREIIEREFENGPEADNQILQDELEEQESETITHAKSSIENESRNEMQTEESDEYHDRRIFPDKSEYLKYVEDDDVIRDVDLLPQIETGRFLEESRDHDLISDPVYEKSKDQGFDESSHRNVEESKYRSFEGSKDENTVELSNVEGTVASKVRDVASHKSRLVDGHKYGEVESVKKGVDGFGWQEISSLSRLLLRKTYSFNSCKELLMCEASRMAHMVGGSQGGQGLSEVFEWLYEEAENEGVVEGASWINEATTTGTSGRTCSRYIEECRAETRDTSYLPLMASVLEKFVKSGS